MASSPFKIPLIIPLLAAGAGIAKAIDGGIKAKRRKQEEEAAKRELEKNKSLYAGLDTSNPYLNMENVMEDLTVNKQEAEFMKQQQMQQQANIIDQMRGAAGGSGVAALAQSMAQQGDLSAQKAAASIGQQEAANQKLERQEAAKIQAKEREGEVLSRQAEASKIGTLMGMSADEKAAATQARSEAQAQMWGGITDATSGLLPMFTSPATKKGKTPAKFKAMQIKRKKY